MNTQSTVSFTVCVGFADLRRIVGDLKAMFGLHPSLAQERPGRLGRVPIAGGALAVQILSTGAQQACESGKPTSDFSDFKIFKGLSLVFLVLCFALAHLVVFHSNFEASLVFTVDTVAGCCSMNQLGCEYFASFRSQSESAGYAGWFTDARSPKWLVQ